MAKVNITELRQNLPSYLGRARDGEAVEVTVRGRVIARIVPGEDKRSAARARLKALRGKARITGDLLVSSGEIWNAERGKL
jgi:prevent-host-death family protein